VRISHRESCANNCEEASVAKVPANYLWINRTFGKAMKTHERLGKELLAAGPVSRKQAQLVQLAAAAAVRSEGAVHSHVKRALKAKARPAEIYHTLMLLTSTIGFPAVSAALSWAREIIEPKG
jgi:alkylhydroperoxidase/carboxymuconolactone decarboxylase family protein YurZ